MAEKLPPVPYRVPISNPATGRLSKPWVDFFQQLFLRVGGLEAPTNAEIGATATEDTSSEITALQTQANTNTTNIADHEERIDRLEAKRDL
jgi:hypothetical protein